MCTYFVKWPSFCWKETYLPCSQKLLVTHIFCLLVMSRLVKLETSCTVILPPTVSVICSLSLSPLSLTQTVSPYLNPFSPKYLFLWLNNASKDWQKRKLSFEKFVSSVARKNNTLSVLKNLLALPIEAIKSAWQDG